MPTYFKTKLKNSFKTDKQTKKRFRFIKSYKTVTKNFAMLFWNSNKIKLNQHKLNKHKILLQTRFLKKKKAKIKQKSNLKSKKYVKFYNSILGLKNSNIFNKQHFTKKLPNITAKKLFKEKRKQMFKFAFKIYNYKFKYRQKMRVFNFILV